MFPRKAFAQGNYLQLQIQCSIPKLLLNDEKGGKEHFTEKQNHFYITYKHTIFIIFNFSANVTMAVVVKA